MVKSNGRRSYLPGRGDPHDVAAVELDAELSGERPILEHAGGRIGVVVQVALPRELADGAVPPQPRTEACARIVRRHVAAADESHFGVEVGPDEDAIDFEPVPVAAVEKASAITLVVAPPPPLCGCASGDDVRAQ